ncbi:MAG TPA: TlpA disulfide reductase family protein, partial [Kofleriaceae bacterium]|nr:TlpA disulfide reductase family protein [Kofleriaceae bacterium]
TNPPGPRPYLVDLRKLLVAAAALAATAALGAMFVWMTPKAAAREVKAACDGLRASPTNPVLGQMPRPAPDFTAQAHDGRPVKLSDYRGKVVVLNFWASWCNVCKTEKPSLGTMTSELAQDDFAVVTLASDKSWEDVKKTLPGGAPYQVLLDPPADDGNIGAIAASWGIKAVPETFIIDKQGRIRMYLVNKRDWDSTIAETCLQALVDE